jgi:hypothetical protein
MEEKKMTQEESLALITQVIQDTRKQTERNAGVPFLVWGYATLLLSIITWYVVKETQNPHWFFLWFTLPIITLPFQLRIMKPKTKGVKTAIDRMVGWVWGMLGFTAFLITVVSPIAYYALGYQGPMPLNVFFMIALLMSLGTAITGGIIKSRIVAIAGIAGVICSMCFPFIKGVEISLWFGLLFFIMMVIPGHILNYKTCKAHV